MLDLNCFDEYMKVNMHCHTMPTSICSNVTPEQVVNYHVKNGYGAIVLTNHYRIGHIDQFGTTKEQMLRGFLNDYRNAVKAAEDKSLKVFLGAEVKVLCDKTAKNECGVEGPVNAEFLLYGVTEEFLWETFNLCNLTQKELYNVCNDYGVLVYQSHPLRVHHYCIPLDLRYMHGVEVFNPHFYSDVKNTLALAKGASLLMSGGSDMHQLTVKEGGMLVPNRINNVTELADYLRSGENVIFCKEGVLIYNGVQQFEIDY